MFTTRNSTWFKGAAPRAGGRWAVAAAWLLSALPLAAPGEETARPPNVIFILADDMGYGDLSAVNDGRSRTPRLGALMEESVVFSQAYSSSPVCAPARATLLTGRYPHRTGVIGLDPRRGVTELLPDEVTIGELFQEAGYATGLIGKWHTGAADHNHPARRGFDSFEGFSGADNVPSYFYFRLEFHGDHVEVTGPRGFRDRYLTDELSDLAVEFVRRHRDEPFFLHLSHYAPHRPLDAPEERIEPFLEAGFHRQVATVYAMLEIMDEGIGRLLDELDALDLADRTLVIFTSDNGPDPLVRERYNAGLDGAKYSVHEGGIRVPFFMRWPGVLAPGRTNRMIHFADLFPTLAGACHLAVPGSIDLDGINLWDWLTGIDEAEMPKRFWQWNRGDPEYTHNAAMRDGDWKLVRPFGNAGSRPWGPGTRIAAPSAKPPLLFRIDEDPSEKEDLAERYPGRVRRMMADLTEWTDSVEKDRLREQERPLITTRGAVSDEDSGD